MNCAESQDLLLDLAYGELPAARAAEVLAHVEGCAACRAEKEQLEDARRTAAPLRELEEPPAGFDEPILRAARAEAGLQSDGTPGPVVEVSATVRPLGLQAARLDPHAPMSGPKTKRQPSWARRAAAVASIAAAAGLAVVVTSSVNKQQARAPAEQVAPIQVRTPRAPLPTSLDDAMQKKAAAPEAESRGAASAKVLGVPVPKAVPSPPPSWRPPQATRSREATPQSAKEQGDRRLQPGDVPEGFAKDEPLPSGFAEPKREEQRMKNLSAAPAVGSPSSGVLGGTVAGVAEGQLQQPAAPENERLLGQAGGVKARADSARAQSPDRLEDDAGKARRRGDYARAAALYRDASALRKESDPARAAWDMAHAVECLAAGGQVDEAVAVRQQLLRDFPGQTGPKAAADSALRSVRLPADEKAVPAER
jgi:Putative zinc-finger